MRRLPGRRHVPPIDARKERTATAPITPLDPPDLVTIPLRQHIGETCLPTVGPGDRVCIGQIVGDSPARVSAPVHASVSGTVLEVAERAHPLGGVTPAVIIANDHDEERMEPDPLPDPASATPDQLRAVIRAAGIVGMAGAAYPSAAKLDPPPGAAIDTVIVNVMEGEPYLSCDHRVAYEHPDEVVDGLELIMRIVGAGRGIVAVEEDKQDAAEVLEKAMGSGNGALEVVVLPRDFAAGAEKVLIKLILGREVPSGGLPYDLGVVSQNVSTTVAISRAVRDGRPLVERVVTVAGGAVSRPGNYAVRVGTSFADVLRQTGADEEAIDRLVMGGPMMGVAQPGAAVPVVKPTTGVLALRAEEARQGSEVPCIHCAWCVEACPVGLMPFLLVDLIRMGEPATASDYHLADCFECGLCDYVCPSNIPLVAVIRSGKQALRAAS